MLGKLIIFGIIALLIMRIWSQSTMGRLYKQVKQQQRDNSKNQQRQTARPNDGNVNVDYAPKSRGTKSTTNFKGGDYVDYEEVD